MQANVHISTHGNTLTVRALDADGFLADVGTWTRDLARQIAAEHGIASLTQAHWAVVC